MQSLLLRAATAASGTVGTGAEEPISLFSSLAIKGGNWARALFADDYSNSTSMTDLLIGHASSAADAAPLSSLNLVPANSTLLACGLAIALYVASWTVLAGRSAHAEDEERSRASYVPTKKSMSASEAFRRSRPVIVQALYAFCSIFVFLSQCVVYLWHLFLNRCVPFRSCNVYLRGFACAVPPEDWTVSTERFRLTACNNFGLQDKCVEFCLKLLGRSGLGEQTYFPPGIMSYPPDLSMQSARAEADWIFGNALDQLWASTGIKPKDVDILIVNCSLFAPTPSLAAMIVHKYGMREDINSYNLSGMGCSAGLISIHLAKDLLRTHPNSIAVVVSTELITQQIYTGSETNMLLQNSLFRSGGAAIALTNKSSDYAFGRVKYQLQHTVRVTMAADNEAYHCVFQDEDGEGKRGVRLEKALMTVAGRAMVKNISRLGPKILPWSEQLKFAANLVARTLDTKFRLVDKLQALGIVGPRPQPTEAELKAAAEKAAEAAAEGKPVRKERYKSRIPEYTPNFKTCIDHIAIHAGGRAVIDAIQKGLNLTDEDVLPSRATLKRYGNTSSSSIWYEFKYIEQNRQVKKGEQIWQLGFGSGFKCNSAVWKKL